MLTPNNRKTTKRNSGVYAAFKSPLKVNNESGKQRHPITTTTAATTTTTTDAAVLFDDDDVRNSKMPKMVNIENNRTTPQSTDRRVEQPQLDEHDKGREQQQQDKENIPTCSNKVDDSSKHVDKDTDDDAADSEIEKCIDELLSRRQYHSCYIDLEIELSQWRSRLHAYNEAKDACIQLFGLLSNYRGCLVRELYPEFNMDLDD